MIVHIPLTALFLIAFTCTTIGAGLGVLLMALAQAGRRRPSMEFDTGYKVEPRRVVWHEGERYE
jgi:hypothetical protein